MNPIFSFAIFFLVSSTGVSSFPAYSKRQPLRCLKCDVGIVGGGFSGLYMAYRLLKTEKETRVCIFEKDSRLGGRIHDFRFPQAPVIHVGLGAWRIDKNQENMIDLMNQLRIPHTDWTFVEPNLYESRGIKANNPEDIKQGYPSLLAHPLFGKMTKSELYSYVLQEKHLSKANEYATANTYVSDLITAEGRRYLADLTFHKGEFTSFVSPKSFIEHFKLLGTLSDKYVRPKGGMSTIVKYLKKQVKLMGGKFFINTEVKSLSTRARMFVIKTSKSSFKTRKLIIATTPEQLKNISGSIARRIQKTEQLKSIEPIPAFKGAAVYDYAWWEDVQVADTPVEAGQRFFSSSNCLGLSLAHRGKGSNGEGVLHTMYNDGYCARRWNDIATMNKNYIDAEVHRALETKYGTKIPKPLNTSYQFWDSAWHFQKAGTPYSMVDISNWAKRPLKGLDVFLVGEAFHPFRGWCEGAIVSCKNALQEGWGIQMDGKGRTTTRSMETKVDVSKLVLSKRMIDLL